MSTPLNGTGATAPGDAGPGAFRGTDAALRTGRPGGRAQRRPAGRYPPAASAPPDPAGINPTQRARDRRFWRRTSDATLEAFLREGERVLRREPSPRRPATIRAYLLHLRAELAERRARG